MKVGDKVICIEATGYLVKGMEYTIEEISYRGTGIKVEECFNSEPYKYFRKLRFKKVVDYSVNKFVRYSNSEASYIVLIQNFYDDKYFGGTVIQKSDRACYEVGYYSSTFLKSDLLTGYWENIEFES